MGGKQIVLLYWQWEHLWSQTSGALLSPLHDFKWWMYGGALEDKDLCACINEELDNYLEHDAG